MENDTRNINWRLLLVMLLLWVATLPMGSTMASNITNAEFYGIVMVGNNDTEADDVFTTANISTQVLLDGAFVNSTVTNVVMRNTSGSDIAFMPGVDGNDWCLYVDNIGEDSYKSYILYTGDSITGGDIAYFAGDTGMETTDVAGMETAANFSLSMYGYFNTDEQGDVIDKDSAFLVTTTQQGGVVAAIDPDNAMTTPTNDNDPDAFWTDDADCWDDNTATGSDAGNTNEDSWTSYMELTHAGVIAFGIRTYAESDADWTLIDVDFQHDNTGTWHDVYQGAYNNTVWDYWYLNGSYNVTDARVRFYNDGATQPEVDLFREIDFVSAGLAICANVTEGEAAIVVAADGVDFTITVDGSLEDTETLGAVTTPDNGNDWYVGSELGFPYIYGYNHTVGGNLVQQIEWEHDTTFTDQSGEGNDATPKFRTASSDDDVIGWLSSFLPVEEADAPAYSLSDAPDFITTAPNLTGNFSTTVNATHPGADLIVAVATAGATPAQLPMHLIWGFVIIATSLLLSWAMRRFGSGNIFVKMIWVGAAMGVAVGVKVYDPWMIIIFVFIGIALAMASRQQVWQ